MDAVLGDLFGSLGGVLTIFILAVCILAIPLGIYYAMKKAVQESAEQDRLHEMYRQQENSNH